MWIYTKPRSEHDIPFMLNLALCSRVQSSQLGERWFVEVMLGTEAVPVAAAPSQEEALDLIHRIFDSLTKGDNTLDLHAQEKNEPAEDNKQKPTESAARATPAADRKAA